MTVAEKIHQHVHKLPESFQVEVLDFVEYLLSKADRDATRREELVWSDLSLALAMRGMEDEDAPQYSIADLKEMFS